MPHDQDRAVAGTVENDLLLLWSEDPHDVAHSSYVDTCLGSVEIVKSSAQDGIRILVIDPEPRACRRSGNVCWTLVLLRRAEGLGLRFSAESFRRINLVGPEPEAKVP